MALESENKLGKYKGQWGGKIENGEEMWWTEPHDKLFHPGRLRNFFGRLRFKGDVRHYFLITYLERILSKASTDAVVLDFGCGTGGITISFAKYFRRKFIGFDIFQTQLNIGKLLSEKFDTPCDFRMMNADGKFPLADQSVDAIFSGDVLGHVPNIPETLKEWARVLKKGGGVSLFTEATYSHGDRSVMARLAKQGMDICAAVPEHISMFPKEKLEVFFHEAGFEVEERKSANLLHWFFFPKDYVLLFRRHGKKPMLYYASVVWNALLKISPFYPIPVDFIRLTLTRWFGSDAYGTSYFYLLRKR